MTALKTIGNMVPLRIKTDYELKQSNLEAAIRRVGSSGEPFLVSTQRNRDFVFDLSETYWYDLGALLWLIGLLHKLKAQGVDIQLDFPEPIDEKSENVWGFLVRWGFFEALSKCIDDPANLLKASQLAYITTEKRYRYARVARDESGVDAILHTLNLLEITTILPSSLRDSDDPTDQPQFERFEGKIVATALSAHCGWTPQNTRVFFQRVIREGIRNSLLHANGSFVNMAMRLDAKNLTVAIMDNGVGIPTVLRQAFKQQRKRKNFSDAELIKYFTEPDMILDSHLISASTSGGVTSTTERSGFGLYYLKSHVLEHGGELRIRSGNACVDFTVRGEKTDDNLIPSPGTLLRIQTPRKAVRDSGRG